MNHPGLWGAVFLLGAWHGINPGMGWLFALALGLQEKTYRAILRALAPITLGHAASVGLLVAGGGIAKEYLPPIFLRIICAAGLAGFGLLRLLRARHFRWVGMRAGFRDLTVWSFLMASAHGAGLMLLPIILVWPSSGASAAGSLGHMGMPMPGSDRPATGPWLAIILMHTLAYLMVMTGAALLVYAKLGVSILRRAWLNLDLLWAIALVATGVLALVA